MYTRTTHLRGATLALVAVLLAGAVPAAEEVQTWDGLTRVKAKRIDAAFLLPGADFTGYNAVNIEPVEVAFRENWQRDMNRTRGVSRTVTDEDVQKARAEVAEALPQIFAKQFEKSGWTLATQPRPGVLALRCAVIDINVTAPDTPSAGRTRTYTWDAGSATLALEVRDSQSRQLLGRAVDARATSGTAGMLTWTTSVTNRAEFRNLFNEWARLLVNGLNELREGAQPQPLATKKKN